ncbi:unnamed protein product [Cyprideis torosa]|uniref:Uncharacterized protein n=1 Tax=Cyprideis torosa TaxID=163714 RepID=A0A7R8ZN25_9CRUS|nr:unnamed protein product [Cyprideis torosa]CAG0895237.1 unnamed protein product [Cyprideis torosa]
MDVNSPTQIRKSVLQTTLDDVPTLTATSASSKFSLAMTYSKTLSTSLKKTNKPSSFRPLPPTPMMKVYRHTKRNHTVAAGTLEGSQSQVLISEFIPPPIQISLFRLGKSAVPRDIYVSIVNHQAVTFIVHDDFS